MGKPVVLSVTNTGVRRCNKSVKGFMGMETILSQYSKDIRTYRELYYYFFFKWKALTMEMDVVDTMYYKLLTYNVYGFLNHF